MRLALPGPCLLAIPCMPAFIPTAPRPCPCTRTHTTRTRAHTQSRTAHRDGSLDAPSLLPQGAFLFFSVFMRTMRREWFGIDRLRLDKFMLLMRKFVSQMLACLKKAKW